jgi:hypothetical protein
LAKKKKGVVKDWLTTKAKRETAMAFLASAVLVPVALLVLNVTWFAVYLTAMIVLSNVGASSLSFAVAWIVLVLLFVGNWTTDREYLDKLEFEMDGKTRLVVLSATVAGYGALNFLAGPQRFHSFVKILTSILYIGPRMCDLVWAQFQRGLRLSRLDAASCSRVIATLTIAGEKVSLADLFEKHHDLDPDRLLSQLHDIDGVLFLTATPPGLSLSTDLREELAEWRRKHVMSDPD